MNTFLLILGLTVIYYIVLFYFDNKRKKAFQLAKNNAIGRTAKLPTLEEIKLEDLEINPEDLFGKAESLEKSAEILETPTIVQKAIAAKNVVYQHSTKNVTEDLKELAVHYKADETIEVPKETLIESINKVGNKDLIGEKEISAFIKTPKLSTDSKS